MAVLHDYKCSRHGFFESRKAQCPMKDCHEEVLMVFLKPPGMTSDNTKKSDKTLKQLAMDFDMTNIKSAKEGENQSGYYTRKNKTKRPKEIEQPRQPRPGDAAIWGGHGGMNLQAAMSGQFTKSIKGESAGVNLMGAGLTGPRTGSYIADHQNLSLDKT